MDPLKPQKVCGKCFDLLLPMQPYLTSTLSKAVQAPDYSAPSLRDWAGKPISRSFKLEIKKSVHTLQSFLGMPDDGVVRRLLDRAHGLALLSIVKLGFVTALQGGGGLVLAKDQASGAWSAPCCIGKAWATHAWDSEIQPEQPRAPWPRCVSHSLIAPSLHACVPACVLFCQVARVRRLAPRWAVSSRTCYSSSTPPTPSTLS